MKKFIVWGHKYNNHSHSHIHYGYKKAFEYLGWETYWFDDRDDVSNFDFSNSLFLTEGQVDNRIPIRSDCKYILHNCNMGKYQPIINNCLVIQVYNIAVLDTDSEKMEECVYYQKNGHVIYQPWATDLTPNEIQLLDKINLSNDNVVNWVGSVWDGNGQGNINQINELTSALKKHDIRFENIRSSYEENKRYINTSFISPSIQGTWQLEKDYIPCRIFKNISYGEFGITNSKKVFELLENKILFDTNIENLVDKAIEYRNTITLSELNDQISLVKNKHTFINRIDNILKVI
jgi:hypothetical protein